MTSDFTGIEKLIAAIGTALAALLTPIGVIYVAAVTKKNKSVEESISTYRERIEELQSELDHTRQLVAWEKASGLRWYQQMMEWYNHAQDVRRHALDARQVANSYSHKNPDLPQPKWNESIELPPLDVKGAFEPMPERKPV